MKILKPGKVEQRKFTCPKCGCVFVASRYETEFNPLKVLDEALCPTCNFPQNWWDGKPYEEPVQDDRERLDILICDLFNREPISRECIVDYLLANGVTFAEVKP